MTQNLNLPDRPILLDGGMGRELRSRGVNMSTSIWSAMALISAPDTVRQIHQDYISAGADIITTNTYVFRWLQAGATVVGGCCGTGPAHIAKLKELLS